MRREQSHDALLRITFGTTCSVPLGMTYRWKTRLPFTYGSGFRNVRDHRLRRPPQYENRLM